MLENTILAMYRGDKEKKTIKIKATGQDILSFSSMLDS
jgi:hypothetical protein